MKSFWVGVFLILCMCSPIFITLFDNVQREKENERYLMRGAKHINSVARVDTLVTVDTGYSVVRQAHHDRTMVSADEMKLMVAICKHLYRENDSLRTVIAERSQGRGY